MDNRAVIERIMKNLAFEVEAVPNKKAAHADGRTNSSKTDPLNVKIKVRKKEINGPSSEPEIVLRKVCLVNSTETIMSFDMFMEMESEKKVGQKPRKRLFNKLKPGLCLGVSDDDDQPYTSDVVNSPDKPGGSLASKSDDILRQPFTLAKNSYETFFTTAQRRHRTFLGKKCKPGGCLDPPFGEDKYSYIPSVPESSTRVPKRFAEHKQVDTNENTKLDVKHIDKNKRKSKDLPLKIKSGEDKVKDSNSILNLYKIESPRDSIITYPPEHTDEVHKIRADTKNSEDKKSSDAKIFRPSSIEKSRQSINETSFFSPVKGVKKDPSYVQQEPLKRHSFNPKSVKKSVPISDSINSLPLEQSNTGPSNIDIEPKVNIFDEQQLLSELDSKDIEKIDVKPFIIPIHVDEEGTPINEQNDSLIYSKMESLIEEDSVKKSSIPTNYEPFITPIRIDEEVSAEYIEDIESPIVVIKKHSTQSKNSIKYSNDKKSSDSYQLIPKLTQSPQKVYETVKNKDYDDPKEIKPLFVKERRDTNRILSDQNYTKDLIEESKPDVEKILSDKTEYLVKKTLNESSDIIPIDIQKSVSGVSVELKFEEPSLESINNNDNTLTNDHTKRITEVLTKEPCAENESLNTYTKDDQSDKIFNNENHQNLIENAINLDLSNRKPYLENRLLDSLKQSLDVNPIVVDSSEPKLNLEDKDSITLEQSLNTHQNQQIIVDPSELIPNIVDKHLNSQEQSLGINTNVLDPSEQKFNLKDKSLNSHVQSLDVNVKVLDSSEPTINLKDKDSNSHEQSLDINTEVLDPLESKLILKGKNLISLEQSLIINPKVLDPSETQPNLKNSLMNIEQHGVDKNIFEDTESELNPNEPSIQTGSIIEQHVKVKYIEDQRENGIELPKKPVQIPSLRPVSTNKLLNEEIITLSLDEDKASLNKKKKGSIPSEDTNTVFPDYWTLKSILSESNKNTVIKPKEKIIPDINLTTDPRTVILNLGFHSYLNSKNERVFETVDGNKVNRYPKDSLSIIKSEIQLFANQKYPKLNVPIDSTFDLAIQINQNYNRDDAVPAKTRKKPVPEFPELAEPSHNAGGKLNCEQRICYEKILQNTLTDIYEQKLIPLRKVLRDLKSDIDKLAGQQTTFKKRVHGFEKIKLPRLNVSNKKCGPCKQ